MMDTIRTWPSQPIFVTSTFQDMQAERDHLMTHVFPALEEWLTTTRRHLEWVDLRVGAASGTEDEGSRELRILSVCLNEVRRSRPFLIALIGDRYGWVPPVGPAAAAVAEVGFDIGVVGRSVTELEIEFGALHEPQHGCRSLAYLRAPLPYDAMPPELAALYSDARSHDADTAFRTQRLAELKARVNARMPERCFAYEVEWDAVTQRVVGLESWGRAVEAHLRSALEAEFAQELAPAELNWMEAEDQAMADLVEDRTRGFVGRAEVLRHLQGVLSAPATAENPWGVCILGEGGAGKTALFGELWKHARSTGFVTIAHAAGAGTHIPWIGFMLQRFVAELATHPDARTWFRFTETGDILDLDVLQEALADDATEEQIYAGFGQVLSWAADKRRVVVLIDALDQFDEAAQTEFVAWVAQQWPANARLIVTATPGTPTLRLTEFRPVTSIALPPLDEQEVRELVAAVCARYHRTLAPTVVDALLTKCDHGAARWATPLWLVLASEHLNLVDADDLARAREEFDGSDAERVTAWMCAEVAAMPSDVGGLCRIVISRGERLFGRSMTSAFVGVIAVSRFGLREIDFQALLPALSGAPWDELRFAQLRRVFRGQMRRREPVGRWDFTYRQMRAEAHRQLAALGVDESDVHAAIADHLLALPADDPVRESEVMLHLIESANWARAASAMAALDDETAYAGLTVLVEQLRWPVERTSEDAAQRLVRTLTAPGLDEVASVGAARGILEVHYRVYERVSLRVEEILLTAVDATLRRLGTRHPDNDELRDVRARCLHFLGHLRTAQGDLAAALTAYREVEEIETARGRHGASLSIGDALLAQGDFDGALACYRDPSNAGSYAALTRIGALLRIRGDFAGAVAAIREGIDLIVRDIQQDPDDQNLRFQFGIAQSALADQGDLDAALHAYMVAMHLVSQTAEQDPLNPKVQSEWGVLNLRIARLQRRRSGPDDALLYLRRGQEIMERLVERYEDNPHFRRDLSLFELEWGDLKADQGEIEEATAHWRAGAAISERLVRDDPTNAEWKGDLAVARGRIAMTSRRWEDVQAALAAVRGKGSFGVREHAVREIRQELENLARSMGPPGRDDTARG